MDESWIQDEPPGNPRPLLRTVTLPVDEILGATAPRARIKDSPDGIRRTTVNDPGRRWGRNLGRQRREEDMFELGLVENRMDPERCGQLEPEGDRV
ncbi:hypothetical protein ROHU_021582 [Labeo rohita]|uniref:Uncharacterized protein n=1 Tax=Labeo rohita TaxID=84645 RepID=A0A498MTY1_LABRO|nr:hypothetical protein ROHU_021582 [Labeo rohita]